ARMYSLLLALTVLWTLLFLRLLEVDDRVRGSRAVATWSAYVVLGLTCVYTHYFAFFVVGVHALWAGFARLRRPRLLARWVAALGILPIAYLPWLMNMSFGQLDSFQKGQTTLDSATVIVKMLDDFTFGQRAVPDERARLVFGGLLALGVLGSLLGGARARRGGAFVAMYLCLPLAAMLVLNGLRSAYQPRLVMLATPGLYLLFGQGVVWVGGLVARALRGGNVGTPAGVFAGAGVLAVALLPLANIVPAVYYDAAWQRDDYRGAVRYVEANAKADDAIVLDSPYQGDIVRLYYKGAMTMYPLPVGVPPDRARTEAALVEMVQQHGGIWAMLWGTRETDPENIVERWLDAHVFKALDKWFGGVRLTQYLVARVGDRVPLDVRFGDGIRLVGYAWQKRDGAPGEALPLILYWEGLKPMDKRYKVFVHLLDDVENIWGQRDSEPAGGARPTSDWRVGETIEDRIGMPVQADAPLGRYQVEVGLYEYPSMARPRAIDGAGQPLPGNRVLVGPVEVK
ncbi:MAG: hypothetical protein ACYC7H_12250, partial [Chloroflexota bacterium]